MKDQDACGRFTPGNRAGVTWRFQPGRSGNPRGRPPKVRTYIDRYRTAEASPATLRRIVTDRSQPRNARLAACGLLIPHISHHPIPCDDPQRARRLFYRWVDRSLLDLLMILLDHREAPERREGARLRLEPWP